MMGSHRMGYVNIILDVIYNTYPIRISWDPPIEEFDSV